MALSVQKELRARSEEADSLRRKEVDRARYEAELSRRRYMRVDPDNRLVADELEAEWNGKLRFFRQSQDEYERRRDEQALEIDGEASRKILSLATDFPRLWKGPSTPQSERKRMVRLLIEDVALTKEEKLIAKVRFKGGAMRTLEIAPPLKLADQRRTQRSIVEEVDRLLDQHTVREISEILRERGLRSGTGGEFTVAAVRRVLASYRLKTRYQRLRAAGLLTSREVAEILGIDRTSVYRRRLGGKIKGYRYNDRGQFLYERPATPKSAPAQDGTRQKPEACSRVPDEV